MNTLKLDFEKHYAVYTSHLQHGQVGTKMMTTSNNESIHNALKNHYKLKLVSTLIEFFSKICDYFVNMNVGLLKVCLTNNF